MISANNCKYKTQFLKNCGKSEFDEFKQIISTYRYCQLFTMNQTYKHWVIYQTLQLPNQTVWTHLESRVNIKTIISVIVKNI